MKFWEKLRLRGRILGLSPMDGVTDAPFRYMAAKYGRPDVIFTEFVSVDGLHFATGVKRERMLKAFVKARDVGNLAHKPFEIAQIFGSKPEFFAEAAVIIEQLGFDGVDINMGCPAKNVSENGCGAGLIRTPRLAIEIVQTVRKATKLPVSIKTRLGVSEKAEMKEWIAAIMEAEPACISLHGRTLKQMYAGEADWEAIGEAAEIVHCKGGIILGNGDIKSVADLQAKIEKYGVDGGLIGRAAQGNPAVFAGINEPTIEQKKKWMNEHAKIYEKVYGDNWFVPMRKHLAWYAHGFAGAGELRQKLVRVSKASEVKQITESR